MAWLQEAVGGLVFTAPRPEQSGEGSGGHLRREPAD